MAKISLGFILLFIFPLKGFSQAETQGEALFSPPSEIIEEVNPEGPEEELEEIPDEFSVDPLETAGEPLPLIKKKRQKIDSRFLQNKRLIEHPNASRGLIKIDKDRNYIYKVPTSEQNKAVSFRVGVYTPDDLENPESSGQSFSNLYDEDDFPMIQYDYEKLLWRTWLGHTAWKFGAGFYIAQGNGQFENAQPADVDGPREKFTLLVFPLSLGLSQRFQFWDTQPIVPFAGGGVDYFAFAERRDDDNNPSLGAKIGGAPTAHFNLGGTIRLGRGARAFVDLDREYGINAVSLIFEYRNYIALSDKFDFSSDFIGGGLLVEY